MSQVIGEDGSMEVRCERLSLLERDGHRSDVRVVALSGNDDLVATASQSMLHGGSRSRVLTRPVDELKVWDASARSCMRTLVTGECTSMLFTPGDRYVCRLPVCLDLVHDFFLGCSRIKSWNY